MSLENSSQTDERFLKRAAACASISVAVFLCIIKSFAALSTGSLAVLSSLIDSFADVFASSISFIAVRFSTKPATCQHRYGYGRAESVSALIQSAFVAGSGLFVLYDGFSRFISPVKLQKASVGIGVMVFSLVLTLCLIMFQKYVTKKTKSPAIDADSAHYTVDVLTNASIILSLIVVKIFNISWFDILTAFVISLYLIYNAYKIAANALAALTDQELPTEIRANVIKIVLNSEGIRGYHDFRSRDLGGVYHFEIHLELDGNLPLSVVHELTDKVEDKIRAQYANAQITIHQDPFGLKENRLDYSLSGHCDL